MDHLGKCYIKENKVVICCGKFDLAKMQLRYAEQKQYVSDIISAIN